jgi:hypothetical protein
VAASIYEKNNSQTKADVGEKNKEENKPKPPITIKKARLIPSMRKSNLFTSIFIFY